MQYRQFGKLDWQPSALGFGLMRLPTLGGNAGDIDMHKTAEMILTAIEGGVNYFDTAYVYHEEQSEVALGTVLAENNLRDRVRIATKLPIWQVTQTDDFDRMLDEELKRLQTDHIDFYLMHALKQKYWDRILDLGLLERAEAAIADGRIRHLGFSFHDQLDVFKTIVDGYDKWTFCQIQYNYMDTGFQAGKTGLDYAHAKGLAVIVMEPLRGGKLAGDIPAAQPHWEIAETKRTPVDWALQWLWNQPEVALVLSGMSTNEQMKQNIASADRSGVGSLTADEVALVERVAATLQGLSPIPCTQCMYCMPCPYGVDIPRNFDYYNRAAMYNDLEQTRARYKKHISDEENAAACIQCGECLPKCPQNIEIPDWMPVVHAVLGEDQPYVKSL